MGRDSLVIHNSEKMYKGRQNWEWRPESEDGLLVI